MELRSTAGQAPHVDFQQAIRAGLAPDGGLYQPVSLPAFTNDQLRALAGASFAELSAVLARRLLGDEIDADALAEMCRSAFDFPLPLRTLERGRFVLELFGGPTLAFKDVGARFLARALRHQAGEDEPPLTVLVATSGDTGSAVAHAFAGLPGVRVFVLYPGGGVSEAQRRQFSTLLGNVHALEVAGTFDDCQALVKAAFADPALAGCRLASANSINIGRLLPQAFYYVFAYCELLRLGHLAAGQPFVVAVPCGNFGNLTAGVYARQLGVPILRLVAATNRNDVVPQYLRSGRFVPRPSVATLSNAMDVGNPSNFARLLDLAGGDWERLRSWLWGAAASDDETLDEMRSVFARTGYLLDPHAAVATWCLRSAPPEFDAQPAVVLATAHPAKFEHTVARAIGRSLPPPPALRHAAALPERFVTLAPRLPDLRQQLLP